jgi:hypothetical protein
MDETRIAIELDREEALDLSFFRFFDPKARLRSSSGARRPVRGREAFWPRIITPAKEAPII